MHKQPKAADGKREEANEGEAGEAARPADEHDATAAEVAQSPHDPEGLSDVGPEASRRDEEAFVEQRRR